MKKLYGGVLIASLFTLFMLMILRYGVMKNPIGEGYLTIPVLINGTNPLLWINPTVPDAIKKHPDGHSQVISSDILVSSLFTPIMSLSPGVLDNYWILSDFIPMKPNIIVQNNWRIRLPRKWFSSQVNPKIT